MLCSGVSHSDFCSRECEFDRFSRLSRKSRGVLTLPLVCSKGITLYMLSLDKIWFSKKSWGEYSISCQVRFPIFIPFFSVFSRLTATLSIALFLLNFSLSRPPSKALLRPSFLQFFLFVLCIATGVTLVQVTTNEGYLNVMRQAPSLGVLWCWSVVRMDLGWAVAALTGVGIGVWARGQGDSLMWWRNLY